MPLSIWYWLFYVLFVLFGAWLGYRSTGDGRWGWGGSSLLLAILLFIIGLKLMGSPIAG